MKMRPLALFLAALTISCTRYAPRTPKPLAIFNSQINSELADGTWLSRYDSMPNGPDKLAYRNHLINAFVWACDQSYGKFEIQFYSGKAKADIVGDFLGLGLGGASVLVGAAHTKTILALAATTIIGAKASLDSRWYDSASREAIVSEMRALRANQLMVIYIGMNSPIVDYSLDQGIIDTQGYYQAGTVVEALQEISQNAEARAAAARVTIRQMRSPSHN